MIAARKVADYEGIERGEHCYYRDTRDGNWYLWIPRGGDGLLANLASHRITEHEDGTITASPSILVTGWDGETQAKSQAHGYLERGVWRDC